MSTPTKDLSAFLTVIDTIAEELEAPRRLEDAGAPVCTEPQLSALKAISKHGELGMSDLAASIDVPVSTATRIVDQLVGKKLLKRQVSSKDARRIEVGFSALGKEISQYIIKSRKKQARSMLKVLSEKDRATLLRQLFKLIPPTE